MGIIYELSAFLREEEGLRDGYLLESDTKNWRLTVITSDA